MAKFRAPMQVIRFAEGEQKISDEIQLFRTGTFFHDEYGQFQVTPEMLAKMLTNFEQGIRGVDLAIDYKHASDDIAAGWIKSVYLSEDGNELWAKVNWTPKGSQVLSEKEFRYISPEFMDDYQDNESLKKFGPTLLGAGLTNRPTIKNMEAVVELSEADPSVGDPKPKSKTNNSPKGVKSMGDKPMDPAALDAMSPEDMKAYCLELMKQLEALSGDQKAMADKVACMEKDQKLAEKKSAFAKLLSEGRAVAAQEVAYIEGDMGKFAELSQKLNLSESGNDASGENKDTVVTADQAQTKILELAEKKIKENSKLTRGQAISLVLKEHKDLSAKAYA